MSLGINLRVTGHSNQGGRKYMEDYFSVAYQASEIEKNNVEYAYFGIFDGHGGSEAAKFAKDHLLREIVNNKLFWSKYDSDVLRAIREGYISTHYAMWREQEKWPKTATGLPSTAGTTASVAFIFRKKIYIGHVGDSGIVLGYQEDGEKCWKAKPLTQDHKPECNVEKARIVNSGGKVVTKSGVPRVVWNRPRIGHKGPVRRSTPFDEIPFLAVARSLGDLWSYNSALNLFIVSPEPDVRVIKIDSKTFRCLVFGTDGLWNVVTPDQAVDMARDAEIVNERLIFMGGNSNEWTNPSKFLVEKALERWSVRRMRADNTSVITVFLDQPGQPKKSITGNNNGIIDRWSNTTRYELKYEMENEFNPEHIIYNRYNGINSNDVLSSCHAENQQDYYYDQYGTSSSTSAMDREHILNSSGHESNGNEISNDCYSINSLQYSPTSNNDNFELNTMSGLFALAENYDKNMEGGYAFYENTIGLENSAASYKYHNTSSCDVIGVVDDSFAVHNDTTVMELTTNISALDSSFDLTHQLDETTITAHQQNLNAIDPLTIENHQHTTNVEVHNDSSNYSHSFAESYNSLLISSLESDNSSSNSSSGSSCSNNSNSSNSNCSTSSNSDSSGDEEFYDGHHHSYKSLNETGLAGHDRVFHHSPNSSNEEQQEQYQKACMLREDGYSLTKLETRVEQRLRSNYQNNSNNMNNNRNNDTCNNYNNNNNNNRNNSNNKNNNNNNKNNNNNNKNNNNNNDNCNYNSNNVNSKDSHNITNNNKNNNNKSKNYINSNINDIIENDSNDNSNRDVNNSNNCSKLNDTSMFNNNNVSFKNNNNNNSNKDDKNASSKIGDNNSYSDNKCNNSDGNSIGIYSSSGSCNGADNKNNNNLFYEDLQQPQINQKQKESSIETFQNFTELSTEINNYNQYNSITSSYSLNNDDDKNNFISSNHFESNLECNSLNVNNSNVELSNHPNQILNITSNIFTSVESSDDINMNSVIEMETEVLDEEIEDIERFQNIEKNTKDIENSTCQTTEYLLEESIQINEISSSNIEINSPIPSPSSNNFVLEKLEIEPTNFNSIESDEMEFEKSNLNLKTTTNNKLQNNNNNDNNNNKFNNNFSKNNVKTKILKLSCETSFPPDKQNENENMQTKSNTLNYIRRSLRSSNNNNVHINYNSIKKNTINNNSRRNNSNLLPKDMKTKKILNKNKSSNNSLTKSIVTKEFLKIVNDTTNTIRKNNTNIILAKLRSRHNNNNNSNNNNNNNRTIANNNSNNNNDNNNNINTNHNKSSYNNIRNNSQSSQSSENLIGTTEKVTVWSKRSRRIIQAINNNNNNSKPNQKLNKALCTNNTANKNICNNNSSSSVITSSSNSFNNNNNSNSKISTNYRFQNNSNSNNKIQHQQNNSISSVSSTTSSLSSSTKATTTNYISTKRSSTSRNSAWCPNKKSVQTRNRVQKR